jgi:hypothetical protein
MMRLEPDTEAALDARLCRILGILTTAQTGLGSTKSYNSMPSTRAIGLNRARGPR